MITNILEYIRQPLPVDFPVVSQSIPVMFFGNIETATHATFGINPSKIEFLDGKGALLPVNEKRFVDRSILGVSDRETLTVEDAEKAYRSLIEYFDRNPYRKWFNVLDLIFCNSGRSYYNDSLLHLDILPWATDPTWGGLSSAEKEKASESGIECLDIVLAASNISEIFLNGRTVINYFDEHICKMKTIDQIPFGKTTCTLKQSDYEGRKVIGWSTNLQSSFGVTNAFKETLRDWINKR